MNHAGEGLLQAYIDGEVDREAEASLRTHLDSCTECGHELEMLRDAASSFHSALAMLEAPRHSTVTAASVRTRAARSEEMQHAGSAGVVEPDATVTPIETRRRNVGRFAAASLARAAALVLLVAGAAAAMIPGSPLRRWISERIVRITHAGAPKVTTPVTVTKPAAPAPRRAMVPGAEMSIAPEGGRVSIGLTASSGSGELVVRIVDASKATVQTDSSAHAVAFRSAPGRIDVMNLGSADALIELPRSLNAASVEVNGKAVLTKDSDGIHVNGSVLRRSDTEIVFQTGS
jgi:hypothetical protein